MLTGAMHTVCQAVLLQMFAAQMSAALHNRPQSRQGARASAPQTRCQAPRPQSSRRQRSAPQTARPMQRHRANRAPRALCKLLLALGARCSTSCNRHHAFAQLTKAWQCAGLQRCAQKMSHSSGLHTTEQVSGILAMWQLHSNVRLPAHSPASLARQQQALTLGVGWCGRADANSQDLHVHSHLGKRIPQRALGGLHLGAHGGRAQAQGQLNTFWRAP